LAAPTGGNYWSDWTSPDVDPQDGFVDNPYVITTGVQDDLPWTAQDGWRNQTPIADAGEDQTVAVGDIVYLDGSASDDPDGDPLGFEWTFDTLPSGSDTFLEDYTSAMPSFYADVAGTYVINLAVDDGHSGTDSDVVEVTAISPEEAAAETLVEVIETITDDVDPIDFHNQNSANALSNKIEATLAMIDEGLYEDALDKLLNDILKKTDGCPDVFEPDEEPDNNDWIDDCDDQRNVREFVLRAIELVERLIAMANE